MDGANGTSTPQNAGPQIDLYEILGVSKEASKNEIKKAYHKAALRFHPDKAAAEEREEAEHRFKAAGQAYEILSDDQKRQLYDAHGMAAFEGGGAGGGMDVNMEDILNMFGMGGGIPGMGGAFGGMGGGRQRTRRSPDENQKYEVTLGDLYKGKTVKFTSTKQVLCSKCNGSGGKEGARASQCATCKGQGVRQVVSQVGPGMLTQRVVPCGACEGTGEILDAKDKCKKCKGKKTTEEKKQLELYIQPGSKEGDQIRLEGEADQVPGAEVTGDIIFHLVELPDDNFQRTGNDLSTKLDVTLSEALFGFNRVVVKHLDGRGIELNHPTVEGKILRPQDVLKIPGEGMPIKRSDAKGDLYLIVEVEFPEDGFFNDLATTETVKKLLPGPLPSIEAEVVDARDYEEADIDDIGGEDGRGAWEDDDEGAQGAQCQTQ